MGVHPVLALNPTAMPVNIALDRVRSAPFVLDAMAEADGLAAAAAVSDGPRTAEILLDAALDPDDQLTAIAAVHGLARLFDDSADAALASLLSHPEPFLREHAAWALGVRLPSLDAVGRLVGVVVVGGFPGMVAQRTLQRWARSAADHVALATEGALAGVIDTEARARLVETMGLVPGVVADRLVRSVAIDRAEDAAVRSAAVAAMGDRGDPEDLALLERLTAEDGLLGATAELARIDVLAADVWRRSGAVVGPLGVGGAGRGGASAGLVHPAADGLSVAQLFLHADIDPTLSQAGAGDNGGIATLLVRLGEALVRPSATVASATNADSDATDGSDAADDEPRIRDGAAGAGGERRIERVITMSRGSAAAAAEALRRGPGDDGQWFAPVPLQPTATGATSAWPSRVMAERGIRRVLRAAGRVDALHLRMADVGSLAAHGVAAELGIPVVFTLAPDPHGLIHALDMTGALTRANFGEIDQTEHYWFRTRLVRRLSDDAVRRVLFPRPELRTELQELLGLDVDAEPDRNLVVPEGIDLRVVEAARADVLTATSSAVPEAVGAAAAEADGAERAMAPSGVAAIGELRSMVRALPAERHGLPLAISVGRLHRVKGMATVVESWASDPALRDRCNLLIVGGDLGSPSPDEQAQLDRIEAVLAAHPEARTGLLLPGHRRNDVVARWLAAAAHGVGPEVAPDGVYVCGSLKEEFGLALLEALASGLPVVAPHGGGPATYVEHGVTGVLVDTRETAEVAAGMRAALGLAPMPGRRVRALATVTDRFTIGAMAATLSGVYADVAAIAATGGAATAGTAFDRPDVRSLDLLGSGSRGRFE